ncbi:MAG: hypothetical protein U1E17_01190 [Geminicoccaceae bacterium]
MITLGNQRRRTWSGFRRENGVTSALQAHRMMVASPVQSAM